MNADLPQMRAARTSPPFARRHPHYCSLCGRSCDYRYACRLLDGRNGAPVCRACTQAYVGLPVERAVGFTVRVGDEPDAGVAVSLRAVRHLWLADRCCDHESQRDPRCLICARLKAVFVNVR